MIEMVIDLSAILMKNESKLENVIILHEKIIFSRLFLENLVPIRFCNLRGYSDSKG